MLTKGLVSNALAKSSLTCPKPGERVPRECQAQACPTSWNTPQNTWRSRGLQGGSRVPSTEYELRDWRTNKTYSLLSCDGTTSTGFLLSTARFRYLRPAGPCAKRCYVVSLGHPLEYYNRPITFRPLITDIQRPPSTTTLSYSECIHYPRRRRYGRSDQRASQCYQPSGWP